MNFTKKPRVLVTYVEAGMGHITSAQAIADALKENYGDKMEIIESHILRDSDNPILPKYERFLVENTKKYSKYPAFGDFQFATMHIIGSQNTLKVVHGTVFAKQTAATVQEYVKLNPDVILCTHYFLLYAAVLYKRKYNPNAVVLAYCPDNNVHGWWDNRADCIYTNNPMATKQAYGLKFRNGNVMETFYPTRTAVTQSNEDKETYRKQFGIPLEKFAVVVADGVYAKAKLDKVCMELLKTDIPLTVCVLAGKNEEIKEKFDELKEIVKPNITLLTFGFLENAPQLYGACDLFITKGGPNAVLDSVMMGTPVLINYVASPLERATKKLFIDHMYCGYYLENPQKIRKLVEHLAFNREELESMQDALKFFDKTKNGASEIADDIAEILWNGKERKERLLRIQEKLIQQFMAEKAEVALTEADEKAELVSWWSPKRAESIKKTAEKRAKKYAVLGEKKSKDVYTKKTSRYAVKAADSLHKKVQIEQEENLKK